MPLSLLDVGSESRFLARGGSWILIDGLSLQVVLCPGLLSALDGTFPKISPNGDGAAWVSSPPLENNLVRPASEPAALPTPGVPNSSPLSPEPLTLLRNSEHVITTWSLTPPLRREGCWGIVARVMGTPAPLEVVQSSFDRLPWETSSLPTGADAMLACVQPPGALLLAGLSSKRELRGGHTTSAYPASPRR